MEWLFTATPGRVKDNMTEQFAISSVLTVWGNDGISPVIPLFIKWNKMDWIMNLYMT